MLASYYSWTTKIGSSKFQKQIFTISIVRLERPNVKRRTERLSCCCCCCWVDLGGWGSWRLKWGIVSGNFVKVVFGHSVGEEMKGLKQIVVVMFMFLFLPKVWESNWFFGVCKVKCCEELYMAVGRFTSLHLRFYFIHPYFLKNIS